MGKVIGNYEIVKVLGEGSFGKTYLARHLLLDEFACIKRLRPELAACPDYVEMLREEAKVLWNVHHSMLPSIREYREDPDFGALLIMTYIPGVNLEEDVTVNGPIDDEHIMWILQRLLDILSYLHLRHQMIHGDIKPANVVLDVELHEAWLIDFGLCVRSPVAATLAAGGTPGYIPPEFEAGLPPVPVSDFYSLGKLAIRLAGGDPFLGAPPHDMCEPLATLLSEMTVHDSIVRRENLGDDGRVIAYRIANIRRQVYGRSESSEMFKRRYR